MRFFLSSRKEKKLKIYWKFPGGFFYLIRKPREPREPMESGKFYALVCLAAGALFVALLLGTSVIKHFGG
jgi:hypothetical protein